MAYRKIHKAKVGRPAKFDHKRIRKLRKEGWLIGQIAERLKCSRGTVSRVLAK